MSPGAAVTLFQWLSLAGFVLTILRLFISGLYRRYPFFSAYLVYCTIPVSMSLALDVRSYLYFYLWAFTEPLLWVFNVVVVLELYSLVLENYKGLYTLGRWALYASMAIAVVISTLTLIPQLGTPAFRNSRIYLLYMVIERGVMCSLLIFLFLILILMRKYPIRLCRNVVVHCVVYCVFFLTNTFALFLHSLLGVRISMQLNAVMTGAMAFSVLLWLLLLSRKGETVMLQVSSLSEAQEDVILSKLSSLNATVLQGSRK
jgi:hypothetical protein